LIGGHQLRRPVELRPAAERASASSPRSTTEEFARRAGRSEDNARGAACAGSVARSPAATPTFPIFPVGETKDFAAHPETTCCASCTASSTCSRTRRSSSAATSCARRVPTSMRWRRLLPRAHPYAQDGFRIVALARGTRAALAFPEESGRGKMFHQFLRKRTAARRRLQTRRGTRGQLLGPQPARWRPARGNAAAHLRLRPAVLRHQRQPRPQQDRSGTNWWPGDVGGGGRPQLPHRRGC